MSVAKPTVRAASNTLLQAYLQELACNPLRTKAITSGVLCFIQEILGSHLAGVPPRQVSPNANIFSQFLARAQIDSKSFKMALYGAFISAPMNHVLVGILQRAFAGRTSTAAKIMQILASNLIVAPIQAAVYLASMAVISGAKTRREVHQTVTAGFGSVMRVTWMTSPVAMVVAQKLIPLELWVPFFNLVGFTMGTIFTVKVKRMRLAQERKKQGKDGCCDDHL